ncbi:MAG TPA: tetratricopeptide repeat protein [Burkholderiales bacterium]|nr:tetratricopeptide repeat protein [Burkholderiales bacterium]
MNSACAERWQRIATAAPQSVSLAEGALLIAAEEYADLDVDAYLRRIEEMGATLHRRLRSDISSTEALIALNHYVFEELGFSPNAADFYDPRNSYLNDVLERRLGIPITLAVLYIEIGRRIGLPLHGVPFPSHFLVKCTLRNGAIILDPYSRGASLGLDELKRRLQAISKDVQLDEKALKALLAAATPNDIFARMLRNLRAIHLSKGERLQALRASNRIITLLPHAADEYRERAQLYRELECFRAALLDLREYLRMRPHAQDNDAVSRTIKELEPLAAALN